MKLLDFGFYNEDIEWSIDEMDNGTFAVTFTDDFVTPYTTETIEDAREYVEEIGSIFFN